MNNEDMKSIFDQINNLKNLLQNPKKQMLCMKGYFSRSFKWNIRGNSKSIG